jgi:hypothetical protein
MYGNDDVAETPSLSAVRNRAAARPLTGDMATRTAVLKYFCDPLPAQCASLQNLSARDWKRLMYWLDFSGLALYFLDRMNDLDMSSRLPATVLERLKENLEKNAARTQGMIAETRAIEIEFQRSKLFYAVLKGFSLWPLSVPKLELRRQSDLDYLVAEKDADEARRVLEARGYQGHTVSGQTWEFKIIDPPTGSPTDIYKANAHRCVELHIETCGEGAESLLERRETREFHGIQMPVLSSVDLFLWQGLHVFKHLCCDHARPSHFLEFRRHVMARRDDADFWKQLESKAGDSPRMYLGLGVVTRLIEQVMGRFAPEELRSWSADRLPEAVRLWVDRYGHGRLLADYPGTKFHLLLQQELAVAGVDAQRSLQEQLFPIRLPASLRDSAEHESLAAKMRHMRGKLRFLFLRLRFHVVEGLRYAREARRWRRLKNGRI